MIARFGLITFQLGCFATLYETLMKTNNYSVLIAIMVIVGASTYVLAPW